MRIYKDQVSLENSSLTDIEEAIGEFIGNRLQDFFDYIDSDLGSMVHILVIEPSDALTDVEAELGFSLLDRLWDVVESHPSWYEITVVVSDDGFGWVMSDFKVTERSAPVALTMAVCHDQNPMTR